MDFAGPTTLSSRPVLAVLARVGQRGTPYAAFLAVSAIGKLMLRVERMIP
jgi:hypothetical protein